MGAPHGVLAYPGCSFSAPIGLTQLTGRSAQLAVDDCASCMNSASSRRYAARGRSPGRSWRSS